MPLLATAVVYWLEDICAVGLVSKPKVNLEFGIIFNLTYVSCIVCLKARLVIPILHYQIGEKVDISVRLKLDFHVLSIRVLFGAFIVIYFNTLFSYRLRIFDYNTSRGMWDVKANREFQGFYTITALAWKRDGSRLVCGTLCGAVELFDSVLR